MPGDALVIAERRKRVLGPITKVLEVDEIDCRTRAIECCRSIIAIRGAILDFRRDSADLEGLIRQGCKGAWKPRVHVLDATVEIDKDIGTSALGIRPCLRWRFAKRVQPLTDASL